MKKCKVNGIECCECQPVCENKSQQIIETDKYLFMQLLLKVGCKFHDCKNSIEIHDKNILSYGGVSIEFDKDGKFEGFLSCD